MPWRLLGDLTSTIEDEAHQTVAIERARRSVASVPALWMLDWQARQGLAMRLGPVLDRFRRRQRNGERPRLILHAPPRHGKTELVGRALGLASMWDRPGKSVLYATSTDDRAVDVSRHVRRMSGLLGATGYADHLQPGEKRRATEWDTLGGGGWIGIGAGAATGGIPAGTIIVDDATGSADRYRSRAERLRARRWLLEDVFSRDSGDAGWIVMETRRGLEDLHGWLDREMPRTFEAVTIPHVSPSGDYLWPERYGPDWRAASALSETACQTNPTARQVWRSLHQGEPEAEGGAVWTREMLSHRYPGLPLAMASRCELRVLSVDPASTEGGGNSSAIWHLGWIGPVCYVLGRWSGHWGYPELQATIVDLVAQHRPHATLVEATSNGRAVLQALGRTVQGLTPITATGSKRARMEAASPSLAAGQVRFAEPIHMPWLLDVIEVMSTLTGIGDEEDDDADALGQALLWRAGSQAQTVDPAAYLRVLQGMR